MPIYALAVGGRVRYVGKTSGDPHRRLVEHMRNARSSGRRQRRLWSWLRSLDGPPTLIVLERNPADLDEAERRWIAAYRMSGAKLCNMTDGGEGQSPGYVPSAETRAKVSAALKGRPVPRTEAGNAAIRAAHLGAKRSPETCAKISQKARGRVPVNKRVWTDDLRARALDAYSRATIRDAARELGIGARALGVFLRSEGVTRSRGVQP